MRWQRRPPTAEAAAEKSGAESLGTVPAQAASMPRVAIIGGGVSGLACARRLGSLGVPATVFDTGKRGPGGRASSREWRGHLVDHASQFVAATDPQFSAALAELGAARRWGSNGRLGTMKKSGFVPSSDEVERWVGKEGTGGIVRALAEGVDVRQDVWVPPSNGLQYNDDCSWSVAVPGDRGKRDYMRFDAVVVAHNGKCAERLTSTTPASEVHALLRTNFSASLPRNPAEGSGRFTLNQIYSLVFEVPVGVMPAQYDAVFIETEPYLRWLSSNTAKFRRGGQPEGLEAWTVLSSATFGKQHKVPQEALEGTPKEEEVTRLLLGAVERAVSLAPGTLTGATQVGKGAVTAAKLQLWGAALPISRWASSDQSDFVWSAEHSIGIAGDWLTVSPAQASTIEGAWISGTRLAEHIAAQASRCQSRGLELGEEGGVFEPVAGDFGDAGPAQRMWVAKPLPGEGAKGGGRDWKGGGRGRGRGTSTGYGGDWKGKGAGRGKGRKASA